VPGGAAVAHHKNASTVWYGSVERAGDIVQGDAVASRWLIVTVGSTRSAV
jgi:hypothetical protein